MQLAVFLRLIEPLNLVFDRRGIDLAETAVTVGSWRRCRGRLGFGNITRFGFRSLLGGASLSRFAFASATFFQTTKARFFLFRGIGRSGLFRRAEAKET